MRHIYGGITIYIISHNNDYAIFVFSNSYVVYDIQALPNPIITTAVNAQKLQLLQLELRRVVSRQYYVTLRESMRHLKTLTALFPSLLLVSCATTGLSVINNPKSSLVEISKTADECNAISRDANAPFTQNYYKDPNNSVAQNAAASFGAGAAQGYAQAKLEHKIAWACLDDRGFKRSWLTEGEMAEYNALEGASEKQAYLDKLSLSQRPASTFIDPDAN